MVDSTSSTVYDPVVTAIGAIPVAPRFRLLRDELAQVVCQVRFSPVLRIRQEEAIVDFQEAIRERYPRYTRQEGMNLLIGPGGVQEQQAGPALHRFQDTDGAFSVVLAPDFVALETASYADIEDFSERLTWVTGLVDEHFKPAEITRVGLRFINELRVPGAELRGVVNSALLGPAGTDELAGAVRAFQQLLELEGPDDGRMLLRHGTFPDGGTTVEPRPGAEPKPDPTQARPFYLLDLDAFREEQVSFHVEGIDARLRVFNDQIRSVFAWAIDEDYRRETLGQEDLA